jgi:organic radical activating enzyme
VGRALFSAGKELLGYTPPWGILTGVRPAKIAGSLIRSGNGITKSKRILRDEYFLNPQKAALAVSVASLEMKLLKKPAEKSCSLYVSIPFCPSRCSYCSFVSYTTPRLLSLIDPYIDALCDDLDDTFAAIKKLGLNLSTIYIGGGTPTTLNASQLKKLLKKIASKTDTSCLSEFTLEAGRPDTITKEKLDIAKKYGVTRISVNPQTLNNDILREIGRKGVLALIVETTNAKNYNEVKTHSERIARNILEDVMKGPLQEKTGMIVTTFSSHVERVQAIADIAKKSHREIFFLGRSMERFCGIAQKLGILNLPKNASIYGSPKAVNKALMKADEDRANYLLVTTGHQGEPDALLPRIANGRTPFNIKKGDNVIISAPIIPNPTNAANRHIMERRLKLKGARIYPNAHVSGHAGREDHREFLRMLKPQHIIPAHGDLSMLAAYAELAEEEGYRIGYDIHILRNAQAQVFKS